MNTKNKKSEDGFIFNSYKEDKRAKRKSLALDIIFGLLLAAMCILLMSVSTPQSGLEKINTKPEQIGVLKTVSVLGVKSNLFSNNAGVFEFDYSNNSIVKRNQAIVN